MTTIDLNYYFQNECFIKLPYLGDGSLSCLTFMQVIGTIGTLGVVLIILALLIKYLPMGSPSDEKQLYER